MMDVFPTDWSPRKTSLYLARGARDDDVLFARLALDGLGISISLVDSLIYSLAVFTLKLFIPLSSVLFFGQVTIAAAC